MAAVALVESVSLAYPAAWVAPVDLVFWVALSRRLSSGLLFFE
jgi:hypothetical protein